MNHIKYSSLLILFSVALIQSCDKSEQTFDATGIFEADAVIVSAQGAGQILSFVVEEGKKLKAAEPVGKIDCTTLELQKAQVESGIGAIGQKQFEAGPQVAVFEKQLQVQRAQLATQQEQLKVLAREEIRLGNLVKAKAVPSKQLDDLLGRKAVLNKQIQATKQLLAVTQQQMVAQQQTVNLQNRGLMSEQSPLEKQIALINEQISRCEIVNPIAGTVLLTYTNNYEVVAPGKPLYKIAPMDTLVLRAYISGEQLPEIALNQSVNIVVDNAGEVGDTYSGEIIWIADEAEFTPKTIQTRAERANLVYAMKIAVPNGARKLKIGMYAEVVF